MHVLAIAKGVEAAYICVPGSVEVELLPQVAGDTVFASGDRASANDVAVSSVQASGPFVAESGPSIANLDVVAWSGSDGTLSRFDLGAFNGGSACNIWGVIIPGS